MINTSEQDPYLSPGRAAAFLGLNRVTLARLRSQNRGPRAIRLPGGKQHRYRLSDLEAWMSGGDRASPPPETAEPEVVAGGA